MRLLDAGLWGMVGAAAVEVMQLYGVVKANKNFPWKLKGELPLGLYVFCTLVRLGIGAFVAVLFAAVNPLGPAGAVGAGIAAPKLLEQLGRHAIMSNVAPFESSQQAPSIVDITHAQSPSVESLEVTTLEGMTADED